MQAVASEFGATLHTVTASSVFGAYTGESERRLREAFQKAAELGEAGLQDSGKSLPPAPAVLFLDELDALCPRRDAKRPHESRVVAQLLTLLDGASSAGGTAVVLLTHLLLLASMPPSRTQTSAACWLSDFCLCGHLLQHHI